ncbi:phospholipid-binding protein [Nitrincola tibetensis]|uniref:Phospholipid-binding protein n=1 Tax=Nitrincola tibetensis TaxID=2219697 RepID=A0A364NLL4_9GAMM|nr:BON domain-containing protein [Nitrincola tibetensis]RAU17880.1 phospholipid-binding protein [Nitrincola tibetensis]
MRILVPVMLISILAGISGCSTFVSATRETPIEENEGRRTLGNYIEDNSIEFKSKVNVNKGSDALRASNININSFNGQVLLTGQVPNEATKTEAERVVNVLREIRKIHNELEIEGPTSLMIRANDTYLTGRVKTQLLADNRTEGMRIKVVTENGTVYLMGLVTPAEADVAVDVIRGIVGVRRIVKVFEYIGG